MGVQHVQEMSWICWVSIWSCFILPPLPFVFLYQVYPSGVSWSPAAETRGPQLRSWPILEQWVPPQSLSNPLRSISGLSLALRPLANTGPHQPPSCRYLTPTTRRTRSSTPWTASLALSTTWTRQWCCPACCGTSRWTTGMTWSRQRTGMVGMTVVAQVAPAPLTTAPTSSLILTCTAHTSCLNPSAMTSSGASCKARSCGRRRRVWPAWWWQRRMTWRSSFTSTWMDSTRFCRNWRIKLTHWRIATRRRSAAETERWMSWRLALYGF